MKETESPGSLVFAPEVIAAQAEIKAAGVVASDPLTQSLSEAREHNRVYQRFLNEPVPDVGKVVEHVLDHLPNPVRVRLYYPASQAAGPLPTYLHIHGGGFAQGNINSLDRFKREITNAAHIVTVGIEYALSPEVRYPVARDQVVGALRWLRDQADALGLDAGRFAIGGDSAGGHLALSALQQLRDQQDAFVKTGIIIYGMLSADHSTPSHQVLGDGRFGLSTEKLAWYWEGYTGRPLADTPEEAMPLHASLVDLPPLLLIAAALDPLLDDTLNLSDRLAAAGQVSTPLIFQGVPHAFIGMTRILPQARQALDEVVAHLTKTLGGTAAKSGASS